MSLQILGMGTALPEFAITQVYAAKASEAFLCSTENQRRVLHRLFRMSGVEKRYSVLLEREAEGAITQAFYHTKQNAEDNGPGMAARMQKYEEHAPKLAQIAAQRALAAADIPARAITHVVTVSCTGFFAPGLDYHLINALGLSPQTQRTHVGFMGCHGAMNGLQAAFAQAHAHNEAHVLVCAVELCSLHYRYEWNPEQIVAQALFADGAAAVVVKKSSAEKNAAWRIADFNSFLIPNTKDAMSWRISDNSFVMTLAPQLPERLNLYLHDWLSAWLAKHGLDVRDVKSWAVHPGGPRILGAAAHSLQLAESELQASRAVLREYGNMSSPTILFILQELQTRAAETPCVALAFGPGVVAEAMLIT